MKLNPLIPFSLLLLIFSGCRNATGSHMNISAADLIGEWNVTSIRSNFWVTANISKDVVNSQAPGTGSLLIDGQEHDLNYMSVAFTDILRVDPDYDMIVVSSFPWAADDFNEINGDQWSYTLSSVPIDPFIGHLWHFSDNPQNSIYWTGIAFPPNFNFSASDFVLTVNDTLIHSDSLTVDTVLVSGTVTAAALHLQAQQPAFVDSEDLTNEQEYYSFSADSTFGHQIGFSPSETGTWFLDNDLLHLNYISIDNEGNEQVYEVIFHTRFIGDQLVLQSTGDACEPPSPLAGRSADCFSYFTFHFWPLERNDISEATAENTIEMVRATQPVNPGD